MCLEGVEVDTKENFRLSMNIYFINNLQMQE